MKATGPRSGRHCSKSLCGVQRDLSQTESSSKRKLPVKHRLVIQRQHAAGKDQVQVMAALGATAQSQMQAAMALLEARVARIQGLDPLIRTDPQFLDPSVRRIGIQVLVEVRLEPWHFGGNAADGRILDPQLQRRL